MSEIKFSVRFMLPRPSSMLVLNAVGVLGLAAIVTAVGALAGWPWALLGAGVVMVALSIIGATHEDSGTGRAQPPPTGPTVAVARSA